MSVVQKNKSQNPTLTGDPSVERHLPKPLKGTCPSEKVLVSKNAQKNDFELTNLCY